MAGVTKERIEVFHKALATLEEALAGEKTKMNRDATIQRFEYTVEAFWKAMKEYLVEYAGVDVGSPKGVMREAHTAGLLTLEQAEEALRISTKKKWRTKCTKRFPPTPRSCKRRGRS